VSATPPDSTGADPPLPRSPLNSAVHVLPPGDTPTLAGVYIRHTAVRDFARIATMCRAIYPEETAWSPATLMRQLETFARGQIVACDAATDRVIGSASSLVVHWSDYGTKHTWREITGNGTFITHDSAATTLYGADVMVDPAAQGRGVGKLIYAARRQICRDLNLARIRAMARLQGYHAVADRMGPEDYAAGIHDGRWGDPTLSFQMKQGFKILATCSDYLVNDPLSMGHAAMIEWINDEYDAELG